MHARFLYGKGDSDLLSNDETLYDTTLPPYAVFLSCLLQFRARLWCLFAVITKRSEAFRCFAVNHSSVKPTREGNITVNVSRPRPNETRKPCYRKDDRAMRKVYGCPEKFRESSQTSPATFPEICKGFLFRSILRMCTQNLKFVALSVREIIGLTQKIWAVPRYAHAPFSLKFLKGFCSDGPSKYICQIWSS